MPVNYASSIDEREKKLRKELARQFLNAPGQPPVQDSALDIIVGRTAHLSAEEFQGQFTPGQQPAPMQPERMYQGRGMGAQPAGRAPESPSNFPPQGGTQQETGAAPQQPEYATGAVSYDKATQHAVRDDPQQNAITDYFKEMDRTGGGNRGGPRQKVTPESYRFEMSFLSKNHDDFEQLRGQLTNQYERMDAPARAQFNEIQKRTDAVDRARGDGKIRPLEYLREMDRINQQAQRYKWQYHLIAPGGQIGDTVEKNGIVHTRNQEGLMPTGYTPQFIEQNTVTLKGGMLSVPTSPGKPNEIVKPEAMNRELATEMEGMKTASEAISKQTMHYVQAHEKLNTFEDPVTGEKKLLQEVTPKMLKEFRIKAKNWYVENELQARAAVQAIMDSGRTPDDSSPMAIPGQTVDPLVQERDAKQAQVQQAQMQQVAAAQQAEQQALAQKQEQQNILTALNEQFPTGGKKKAPAPVDSFLQSDGLERLETPMQQLPPKKLAPAGNILERMFGGGEESGPTAIEKMIQDRGAQQQGAAVAQQADQVLQAKLAKAKTPDEAIQIRFANWRDDPVLSEKVKNATIVKPGQKFTSIPDGTVVRSPDGQYGLKMQGKLYQIKIQ